MDKKKIVIVSGSGGILGTGHMQRMLNLAVQLNKTDNLSASIFLKSHEHPLPEKFKELLIKKIPSTADLIIRDMRDSSIEEIQHLRQTAPVLAIDDSGEGRKYADYSLNLLPLPSENMQVPTPDTSLFLYGYNFAEGINNLKDKVLLKRDIDVAVYAGYDPSPSLISSLKKSIPESLTSVLLAGGRYTPFTGRPSISGSDYAGILCRTKIIITHFGLTMFEAHACGCAIAALNPSEYHSRLTETVQKDFNIICSSQYSKFSPDILHEKILNELQNIEDKNISVSEIIENIKSRTDNLIRYIDETCIINK